MAMMAARIQSISSSGVPRLCTMSQRRMIMNTSRASLSIPNSSRIKDISFSNLSSTSRGLTTLVEELKSSNIGIIEKQFSASINGSGDRDSQALEKMYAILESVSDRIEMHKNIGEQRDRWNTLFLTSINTITLAATTLMSIASTSSSLNVASTLLYLAATGMLIIVNKIQPSQLVEEQRNAARLYKQIYNHIQTIIKMGNPTERDVRESMEKVLALDKAYPLPLLGSMLDKFPSTVEPAVWWPTVASNNRKDHKNYNNKNKKTDIWNGWNGKLEEEMRRVVEVLKKKDKPEYLRLGGKALKLNKLLAVTGPLLTGLAAVGSAYASSSSSSSSISWGATVGIVAGVLASVVNTVEHGGQVGMVFEMYRSNAGFFKLMEESIESNLSEREVDRRENGELFEMKVALQLGRSLSELRDLASTSTSSSLQEEDEFASKLF